MDKKIPMILVGILAIAIIAGFALGTDQSDSDMMMDDGMKMDDGMESEMMMSLPDIVNIGVVLPATGDLSSHGEDNTIATKLAAEHFNSHLKSIDATWQVKLVVEDSQTDPNVALEKIQSLKSKGIDLILGPETSAELRNVRSYADTNNMLLLSPSSTSPKLAIDDNVFRFVPDDTKQGKVIAKLLQHNDIKVVIPIYRADVWGDGLYESTQESFESLGGMVDEGIRYSPEITTFSSESELLSNRVAQYNEEYTVDEIAVLAIGFAETLHLLNFANSYDNLHEVQWFGADGFTNDDTIIDDEIGLGFAQNTRFTATQFSASSNEKYEAVRDHLIEQVGSAPNNYAYSSYDSLWVLGLAIQDTQSLDTAMIKEAMPRVAGDYTGAIGLITFNEFGDLAISDYELWQISDGKWNLIGQYYAATDSIGIS